MKENPTTERSEKNFCVFRHQKEKTPKYERGEVNEDTKA